MKNPWLVTKYGEALGLGSRNYKMIEVLSPNETIQMKPPKMVFEQEPSFV